MFNYFGRTVVIAVAALATALTLTGCGSESDAEAHTAPSSSTPAPTPNIVIQALPAVAPKAAVTIGDHQKEKFDYLNSFAHRDLYTPAIMELKRRIVAGMAAGKYGPVEREVSDSGIISLRVAGVGEYAGYVLFSVVGRENEFDNPFSIDISKRTSDTDKYGTSAVSVRNAIHDWNVNIGDQSEFIRFGVTLGDLDTCLWPTIDQEQRFCDGKSGTRTADEARKVDVDALNAFVREAAMLL